MADIHTDILIVGAGPAGVTTSLFLSQMKIPHMLVDAAVFPRDKICGDGLDLKVVRVLRQLDPDIVQVELPANPHFLALSGTRFITQKGRICDFRHVETPSRPLFFCAQRTHFDHFLVQKIDPEYASFRQGVRVEKLEKTPHGWRVWLSDGKEVNARYVVGADGEQSVVLRHLGERSIDRKHYAASLRQYLLGVSGLTDLIEVYFPPDLPMSYFYLFPLPGGLVNCGYGMVSSVAARGRYNLRRLFQKLIETDKFLAPRFANAVALETPQGWGLPLASRRRKASGEGYLLVGDAASLICPTSGEGIGTGMVSGMVAAHFLREALTDGGNSEVFQNYEREIYRRLKQEIRLYNVMMRLHPRVYDASLNALAPNVLFKMYFNKAVKGWLETAYEKPLDINVY